MKKRTKIKQLRKERGWTQRDLSIRTGIASPTISQIENGVVKLWPGYAKRIAKALNVSVEELTS